ncbi:MAG: restriction endonuclease subunit S [Clostridiales Family XIII bacterium]|nr:restriction endonuclease subunit S [Clostridiales Family XIII bacterium]
MVAVSKNATETAQYADLPRREIKWCSVTLSEVVAAGKRLEASVFNPQGRYARAVVSACKWGNIPLCGDGGLATAYVCGRFKRVWLETADLPIYQPSSITDVYPEPDGYLSKNTRANLDTLRVRKGQILLSCSGTIGKVALVSKTLDNQIFSHDLIRMDAKSPIDVGYIYAFLRSKVGNTLLQTNNYGAVIQHIEPEHLADIPVPNVPGEIKAKINDLILRSFELRDESNELIDKATAMFVAELNLPPLNEIEQERFDATTGVNNYTVKLSELTGRFDGSYHVPIAKAIVKHLRSHSAEVVTVGDKRVSKDIILPGRFKRVYVEEGQGRVFIGGKQIGELDPYGKKYLSLTHHGDRIKKQLELAENMTLITCSGTIGKATLVPRHWNNWAASQHIIRIVPANPDMAGYLAVFLASDCGKQLITRFTYGSVVDEVDNHHVSQIPFPLLKNTAAQTEINRLALKANELRYQAYLLEQEAMGVLENDVLSHTE